MAGLGDLQRDSSASSTPSELRAPRRPKPPSPPSSAAVASDALADGAAASRPSADTWRRPRQQRRLGPVRRRPRHGSATWTQPSVTAGRTLDPPSTSSSSHGATRRGAAAPPLACGSTRCSRLRRRAAAAARLPTPPLARRLASSRIRPTRRRPRCTTRLPLRLPRLVVLTDRRTRAAVVRRRTVRLPADGRRRTDSRLWSSAASTCASRSTATRRTPSASSSRPGAAIVEAGLGSRPSRRSYAASSATRARRTSR